MQKYTFSTKIHFYYIKYSLYSRKAYPLNKQVRHAYTETFYRCITENFLMATRSLASFFKRKK